MSHLEPLEVLFDRNQGHVLPLPKSLAKVCGPLRLPRRSLRPYVLGNFATTLDGVVSLKVPGRSGGREITGSDTHDQLLMGVLRAVADGVVVGAGTLRAVPRHRWTAQHIYPPMASEYAELRRRLGKPEFPLNVIVTAKGKLDLRLPLFSEGKIPVLIVTTKVGARRLARAESLPSVRVAAAGGSGPLTARAILRAIRATERPDILLIEGGPHLIGDFFAEKFLDELFLTLAPQIAGREDGLDRPGLVAGRIFAPEHPLWGSLVGVRRGGSHLFLRLAFKPTTGTLKRGAPRKLNSRA